MHWYKKKSFTWSRANSEYYDIMSREANIIQKYIYSIIFLMTIVNYKRKIMRYIHRDRYQNQ